MNEKEQIKVIRQVIFSEAKNSPNLEIMHWWIAVDDCFENDEFQIEEAGNLQWRMSVLQNKKQPLHRVTLLMLPILKKYDLNHFIAGK